jgi:outer membrane autotransporter protein
MEGRCRVHSFFAFQAKAKVVFARCLPGTTVAAIAALAAWSPAPALAQATPFTSISGFGDSYADTGGAPGGAFRLLGFPCPAGPLTYPTCRFSGGTNFVDSLQSIYNLPPLTNYAIGGAQTGNTNVIPGLPGFGQEVAGVVASGHHFGPSDLIALSIGGNDQAQFNSANTLTQIHNLALTSASNAATGVQQLIALGAHNIAWVSPGNPFYFPAPFGDPALTPAQRAEWAHTYFQQIQQLLAPAAQAGTRIFLFDFETLQARILANPAQYGFASASSCLLALGIPGCLTASKAVQNSFFYWDTIHPTSAGFALIARYMANQIDAPLTVAPQADVALSTAMAFENSTFGRLDAYRAFAPYGMGSAMNALAAYMPTKAHPAAAASPWSVYGEASYAGGNRDAQAFLSSYDYRSPGGTIGIEYRVNPNLRVGGVFGYAQPNVDLAVQNAHYKIDAFQFGGYASYTAANWFADGLAAYGRQNFATTRQGIIDIINGSTNGDTFTLAGKTGYLFDAGWLRVGPIAGLSYLRAQIAGYTETGDILLTNTVNRQSIDNLTGSAGVQFRTPFLLGKGVYSPYLNVTAEHDFIGSGHTLITTQVTTPLLPVLTPIDSRSQTYGKVAAGIAAAITDKVSVTASAVGTFGRRDGNDYGASGGVKVAF